MDRYKLKRLLPPLRTLYRDTVCAIGLFMLSLSVCFAVSKANIGEFLSDALKQTALFPISATGGNEGTEILPSEPSRINEKDIGLSSLKEPIVAGRSRKITSRDLSVSCFTVKNETDKSLPKAPAFTAPEEPSVLILHTHATECYDSERYPDGRCTDCDSNVVHIGQIISDGLRNAGINTVHCTTLHDSEDYTSAYSLSAKSVREYTALFPKINIVLDIHRDAVNDADGNLVKTLYPSVEAGNTAQIMLLCGTDEQGGDYSHWEQNYAFGCALEKAMIERHEGLARALCVRGATYNEQLCDYYLLVEIGSFGNSMAEAENAALKFCDSLIAVLVGK